MQIFWHFWLGDSFGYFSKNLGDFFQSSGHPVVQGWTHNKTDNVVGFQVLFSPPDADKSGLEFGSDIPR